MRHQQFAQISQVPDGLEFRFSYDEGMLAALKTRIPHIDRRWDVTRKVWIVTSQHASILAKLADEYLGIKGLAIQAALYSGQNNMQSVTKMIKLEYLGAAKDRGSESTATGWMDDGWNAIFPLDVLQNWFCVETRPDEHPTLFGILGISRDADSKAIRKAYRRLARQWHPDVCKEPDAANQFITITGAYDILSDKMRRARYEAGLQLTAPKSDDFQQSALFPSWRAPLRCGWLLIEGIIQVGRLVVKRILQWEDIRNANGLIMVAYWPRGANEFAIRWS